MAFGWPAAFAWCVFPAYVFKALDAHSILGKIAEGAFNPDRLSFTFQQTIVDRYGAKSLHAIYIALVIFAAGVSVGIRYILVGLN